MQGLRRTFIDGRYGQMHCRHIREATASKPGIVCLHMSPKSGYIYKDLLPQLAEDRSVLAPDYPGHGESAAPPAEPEVSIEDFAACVWEAIDALTDTPVHLVGYHTGSMVAVEAASQRPHDVVGVVNISAPIFTPAELAELQQFFSPIPIDEAGTRFTVMWERVMHYRGPGMTLEMAAASFAENLRGGENYEWGHRAAFAYADTYCRKLAALEHPVFVMNPHDDLYTQTSRVDTLLRNGHRQDFPDWGHGFLHTFPQAAATAMLDFFAKVERQES